MITSVNAASPPRESLACRRYFFFFLNSESNFLLPIFVYVFERRDIISDTHSFGVLETVYEFQRDGQISYTEIVEFRLFYIAAQRGACGRDLNVLKRKKTNATIVMKRTGVKKKKQTKKNVNKYVVLNRLRMDPGAG